MVAYSFKKRFAAPIRAGTKRQTIRAERKGRGRHARPGEALQLYTGMRTKHCEKIVDDQACRDVQRVLLNWSNGPLLVGINGTMLGNKATAEFIVADGFVNEADMRAFWEAEHPGVEVFEGVLIKW